MINVSALGLGIELSDDAFLRVIGGSDVLPRMKRRIIISTAMDSQEKVVTRVFEGEREIASENKLLGVLEFDVGVPKTSGRNSRLVLNFRTTRF